MTKARRLAVLVSLSVVLVVANSIVALAATDPGLATAGNFAVLANTTVTNTGPSWITGQVGVASPPGAVTGFPPGTSGVQHKADSVAITAETDLAAAYTNAANQPCPGTNNFSNTNLGGMTLVPGVYCQTTAPTLTGTLTLNGSGVYIFQIGSTLVTANSARIVLIGGALPCQIFWQVSSSATIAPSTTFVGNIMALASIAMQTGASLDGRALARTGAVTLDTNRITQPTGCGYAAPTAVAAPTPTPSPTPAVAGAPNGGGGPPQGEGFPWMLALVAAILGGAGTISLVKARAHRRRTSE